MNVLDVIAAILLVVFVVAATVAGFLLSVAIGFYTLAGVSLVVAVLLGNRDEA